VFKTPVSFTTRVPRHDAVTDIPHFLAQPARIPLIFAREGIQSKATEKNQEFIDSKYTGK
jgi:hypothetical protein